MTGRQPEQWDTFAYRIPLCTNNGKIKHVLTFGIADIAADLPPVNLTSVAPLFRGVQLKDIQWCCAVDLLLGIYENRLFPNHVLHSFDNLLLCQSLFGSGLLLVGHHPYLNPGVVVQTNHVFQKARARYGKKVHHVLARHLSSCPMLFIPMSVGDVVVEGLGGDVGESMSPENSHKQPLVSQVRT